ncbi:hypothetical protein [Leuconostoc suionicum]|uniref:hypothetical protein n=1 Tax=Leuconostoc suionicum TaxID=1511761 RepID=UPI0032DE66E1
MASSGINDGKSSVIKDINVINDESKRVIGEGEFILRDRYITKDELENSELRQQFLVQNMERTMDRGFANVDIQFEKFNSTTSNINTKIDSMDKKLTWLFGVLSSVVIAPVILWAVGHFILRN